MSSRTVKTQAELNKAIADKVGDIFIESPAGVWLEVRAYGSSTVTACDSSTVRACGSSTVTAYDSSTVRAYDSSTVTAYDSSTVTAYDSSTVRACDSSTVRAYGSSTVTAYGSSTVRACGSSTVRACDSSTVRACDSSTVTAYGSSTVRACDSSTVRASKYTAVHLHSKHVKLDAKGAVLDVTELDMSDPAVWCEYSGVKPSRGYVVLYKAVDTDLKSGRGFAYPIGETVTDTAWSPGDFCGGGLHLGPTPGHALAYFAEATRFLAVKVKVADMCPITGGSTPKAKVRSGKVLHEVDVHGRPIAVTA